MMLAHRQGPSPRAREPCSKPVMTHTRTRRRASRRFTTGKTGGPQWANSVLGGAGSGRQAVAPGRTGASRGRTGVPRENRAQGCQESHRAGMSRTGKHGEDRSSGVVFLGATPPGRKGVSDLGVGACHGSHWTPELRWTLWTSGNPEPVRPTELLAIPSPANPESRRTH